MEEMEDWGGLLELEAEAEAEVAGGYILAT